MPSPSKIHALYSSLDPNSIPKHLAFYQLYPDSPEGRQALQQAWKLLSGGPNSFHEDITGLPDITSAIDGMVNLVNKHAHVDLPELSDSDIVLLDKLASRLPNRKLKGHYALSEDDVLKLPPQEIDLARGLFLTQLGNDPAAFKKIKSYEALIDLMALQILTTTPLNAPPESKIAAMNQLIFEEMGFRFPPHSLYAKDIDVYTFLPSVLDSRRGVCLGVSILYISLAQRLELPLEMITPPGHIFVRYRDEGIIVNIETTARGIHLDSEEYLGIDTRSLQQRNVKEVIGLAHYNQASVYWKQEDHIKALESYCKAEKYLPDDLLLKELMAYNYLIIGNKEEGIRLLRRVKDYIPDYAVSKNTIAEDYLNGKIDSEGIKAANMFVDETRESILEKKEAIEKVLSKYPEFRQGYFTLATAWLQLHREGEALEILKKYHDMDPTDATAEYYLAVIYAERLDYNKAWSHLRQAEKLVRARNHDPKTLKHLRKELAALCPEKLNDER